MFFWYIYFLVEGITLVLFTILCISTYIKYNKRTKPPSGQVPVEEQCIIPSESANKYARENNFERIFNYG